MAAPAWSNLWEGVSTYRGFVRTNREVDEVRKAFQIQTSITYVVDKKESIYGTGAEPAPTSKIWFERVGVVSNTGLPFQIISRMERSCMFGRDKHLSRHKKRQAEQQAQLQSDHPVPSIHRRKIQGSKKKNCKAKIVVLEVDVFPDFKIPDGQACSVARQKKTSRELRCQIQRDKDNVRRERRFYISLPETKMHGNCHPVSQLTGFMNPVSKEIREKIYELVAAGVSSVNEIKRHLKTFLSQLFPDNPPPLTDLAYHPLPDTLRKHIYLSQQRLRYSQLDQENLLHLIAQWSLENPDDRFDCIPAAEPPPEESGSLSQIEQVDEDEFFATSNQVSTSFFFCHQSQYQRHLLRRYGNQICLLDATYRTTKYSLPLFFLAVKTNVGYSVVGEFVVQNETKSAISQGLNTIKNWMAEDGWKWEPIQFMTDFCEREIHAIEEIFPGTFVYICDFHREQSWTRWVSKIDNGVSHQKEPVLRLLRQCAHATSPEAYSSALNSLQNSPIWQQNARLRTWFSRTWLPEYKRWVWTFRSAMKTIVNTNNGLERQNKIFKYNYLEQQKNASLSRMVTILITEYLPSMMVRYMKENVCSSEELGRTYCMDIPDFLRNRPAWFVRHCMAKLELADLIQKEEIEKTENHFMVKSQSDGNKSYRVELESIEIPSCDCQSWKWDHLPCKHIFAVLDHLNLWNQFQRQMSTCPFFCLDQEVLNFIAPSETSVDEDDIEDDNITMNIEYQQLPQTKYGPKSTLKQQAVLLREKVSLIRTNSYLCQDTAALTQTTRMVQEALDFLTSKLPSETGIPLESVTEPRNKKQTDKKRKGGTKPLKLKNKTRSSSKRVGKKNTSNIPLHKYGVNSDSEVHSVNDTVIEDNEVQTTQVIDVTDYSRDIDNKQYTSNIPLHKYGVNSDSEVHSVNDTVIENNEVQTTQVIDVTDVTDHSRDIVNKAEDHSCEGHNS